MKQEYLYNDRVVVKTGRKAVRRGASGKYATLLETKWQIEPLDLGEGEMAWNVWVTDDDLYTIEEGVEE